MIKRVTYSFTRPSDTTTYADGDLVANSTTAGSVVAPSFNVGYGGFKIKTATLTKNSTGVTTADFRFHLYTAPVTVANGDNGALSHSLSGKYYEVDFPTMVAGTDGAWTSVTGLDVANYVVNGMVYVLVEADGAYTPVSGEIFTLGLVIER